MQEDKNVDVLIETIGDYQEMLGLERSRRKYYEAECERLREKLAEANLERMVANAPNGSDHE